MIYLAIPYSFNPEISYDVVNKAAAQLMKQGHRVYSPVSMGHGIADWLPEDVRYNSEFWLHQFLPLMLECDKLVIVKINSPFKQFEQLLQESKGCQAEIKLAKKLGIPIEYL